MANVTWTDWSDGRVSVLIRYQFPHFACGTGNSKKEAVRAAMRHWQEGKYLHARVIQANGGYHAL